MSDLPVILSGVAITLSCVAVVISVYIGGIAVNARTLSKDIESRQRSLTDQFMVWTAKVEQVRDGSNEATSKTAETVSRLVTDIQHLKQDLAKVQRENNPFPGVPGRSK